MRNSRIWITYVGKNPAHRLPLIKCLSNKILSNGIQMTAKGAGAIHIKFWNSLSAFLHAKKISCILILPWTSSNKINHKSVYNLHILKYYLTKDINASRHWSSPERLEDLFLYMVCLPCKAWRYHFIEQPLPEDWGSLSCQETSTLAIVLETWVDRSRETLWKWERIHRSRAWGLFFTPSPLSDLLHSSFNCLHMRTLLRPHHEILEDR